MTDLAPYFLWLCQKFLSKKAKFLITMRAIKSFDTIPFVSSCKFRNSCHNERPNFLTQWEQSKVFLLKSTILYMPVSLWRFIVNKQILVFVKTLTITQVDVVVMIIAKPPRVCSILLVVCSSCLWFLLRYRDCGILEWNPVPFPIPSRTRIPSRYRFLRDTGWGLIKIAKSFRPCSF